MTGGPVVTGAGAAGGSVGAGAGSGCVVGAVGTGAGVVMGGTGIGSEGSDGLATGLAGSDVDGSGAIAGAGVDVMPEAVP
jgi:hypothetical protein